MRISFFLEYKTYNNLGEAGGGGAEKPIELARMREKEEEEKVSSSLYTLQIILY